MSNPARLDAELEALIHAVSHDLGEPLRSLEGFSQALLEDYGAALEGDGRLYVDRIRAATRRLGQRLDALLRLSRATRGPLQPEPVDLGALARERWAARGAEATREASLETAGPLRVVGDPRLLAALLDALLDNAHKFQARTIRLEGAADGSFRLSDDGVGFEPGFAERIFEAFGRYHRPDEYPGEGVGLTIARRIVHRHGGEICAEGRPGAGCTVHFTLG